jgi:photosystem I reaction center subunit VIII
MKFIATLTVFVVCLQAAYGFQPVSTSSVSRTQLAAKTTVDDASSSPMDAVTKKVFPTIAATTGFLLSLGIDPAFAAKEIPPDTSYIGQDFTAAYLPAVMVPLVGLIFPAGAMALFFLFSQQDDIESA